MLGVRQGDHNDSAAAVDTTRTDTRLKYRPFRLV
jgi:hypothetical protein